MIYERAFAPHASTLIEAELDKERRTMLESVRKLRDYVARHSESPTAEEIR
jgi:hypothetical protein